MYLPNFNTLKTALIAVAVAISALCLSGVYYSVKMKRIEAKHAAQIEQVKTDAAEAQARFTEALNETHQQNLKIRADADAATAANGRLRKSLADYRARHANATASTGQGEPNSDPIGVLAELLEGLADRGAEVSRYADEVKIAGAACEKLSIN